MGPVDGQFTDPKLNLNRSLTYYKYSVPLQSSYPVQKQSWYSVYVDPCGWHDSMGAGTFEYDGMEVFLFNLPYPYIQIHNSKPVISAHVLSRPLHMHIHIHIHIHIQTVHIIKIFIISL